MSNLKRFLAVALAVMMIASMTLASSASTATPAFKDLDKLTAGLNKTYLEYGISVLHGLEVIKGMSETEFGTDLPVTRAQMATFLARIHSGTPQYFENATQYDSMIFTDVDKTGRHTWAVTAINYCVDNELVSGRGNNLFDPDATVTLQEAATMLVRGLGHTGLSYPVGFLSQARTMGLFDYGLETTSATKTLTRGEVALLLYNYLLSDVTDVKIVYNGVTGRQESMPITTPAIEKFGIAKITGYVVSVGGDATTGNYDANLQVVDPRGQLQLLTRGGADRNSGGSVLDPRKWDITIGYFAPNYATTASGILDTGRIVSYTPTNVRLSKEIIGWKDVAFDDLLGLKVEIFLDSRFVETGVVSGSIANQVYGSSYYNYTTATNEYFKKLPNANIIGTRKNITDKIAATISYSDTENTRIQNNTQSPSITIDGVNYGTGLTTGAVPITSNGRNTDATTNASPVGISPYGSTTDPIIVDRAPNIYLWNGRRGYSAYQQMAGAWESERLAGQSMGRIIKEGKAFTMHMVDNGRTTSGAPEIYFIFEPYAVGEFYTGFNNSATGTNVSSRIGHTVTPISTTVTRLSTESGVTDFVSSLEFSTNAFIQNSNITWRRALTTTDSLITANESSPLMTNGNVYLYAIRSDNPGTSYTTAPSVGTNETTANTVPQVGRINSPVTNNATQIFVMGSALARLNGNTPTKVSTIGFNVSGLLSAQRNFVQFDNGMSFKIDLTFGGRAIGGLNTLGTGESTARLNLGAAYDLYAINSGDKPLYALPRSSTAPITPSEYAVVLKDYATNVTQIVNGQIQLLRPITVVKMDSSIPETVLVFENQLTITAMAPRVIPTSSVVGTPVTGSLTPILSGTVVRLASSTLGTSFYSLFTQPNPDKTGSGAEEFEVTSSGPNAFNNSPNTSTQRTTIYRQLISTLTAPVVNATEGAKLTPNPAVKLVESVGTGISEGFRTSPTASPFFIQSSTKVMVINENEMGKQGAAIPDYSTTMGNSTAKPITTEALLQLLRFNPTELSSILVLGTSRWGSSGASVIADVIVVSTRKTLFDSLTGVTGTGSIKVFRILGTTSPYSTTDQSALFTSIYSGASYQTINMRMARDVNTGDLAVVAAAVNDLTLNSTNMLVYTNFAPQEITLAGSTIPFYPVRNIKELMTNPNTNPYVGFNTVTNAKASLGSAMIFESYSSPSRTLILADLFSRNRYSALLTNPTVRNNIITVRVPLTISRNNPALTTASAMRVVPFESLISLTSPVTTNSNALVAAELRSADGAGMRTYSLRNGVSFSFGASGDEASQNFSRTAVKVDVAPSIERAGLTYGSYTNTVTNTTISGVPTGGGNFVISDATPWYTIDTAVNVDTITGPITDPATGVERKDALYRFLAVTPIFTSGTNVSNIIIWEIYLVVTD